MDAIDRALEAAWRRVSAEVRGDRVEALRRFRRTRSVMMARRVPRAWCLCLRASDTRLEAWGLAPMEAVRNREMHVVQFEGEGLRKLVAPVRIRWPGVPWTVAARRLGRHEESIRGWIRKRGEGDATGSSGGQAARPLILEEMRPAQSLGKRGRAIPIVWSAGALDPGALGGRGADAVWGSAWQGLHERVPEALSFGLRRVARDRAYTEVKGTRERRGTRGRGWLWVCPGRLTRVREEVRFERGSEGGLEGGTGARDVVEIPVMDGDGVEVRRLRYRYQACGRLVRAMYVPQAVWTIGDVLGEEGFEVEGLSGGWRPGCGVGCGVGGRNASGEVSRELRMWGDPHERGFACGDCWGVRSVSLMDANGWNEFVSYVSGGLLYGAEVERPWLRRGLKAGTKKEETEWERERWPAPVRRQRFVARGSAAMRAERERVLALLLEGLTYKGIARRLGVSYNRVEYQVRRVYREYGVGSRGALREVVREVDRRNRIGGEREGLAA